MVSARGAGAAGRSAAARARRREVLLVRATMAKAQ
jgi:hypothetical protein